MTDVTDRVVRVGCGCRFARSDSPYGFVSDDDFIEVLRLEALKTFYDLSFENFLGKSAFSFRFGFAYADDRFKLSVQSSLNSLVYSLL